jgi:hypothetical protein
MAKLLGSVDLLGLNSFGENPGINALWGVGIGGGVSFATSTILARTGKAAHADLIGFLAGIGAGGVMYAMRSTRHAALGAFAGAFLTSGLKWLAGVLFAPTAAVPAAATVPAGTSGVGLPMISNLGMPSISALNGLGMPAISNTVAPQGSIPGVAGPQVSGGSFGGGPPVSLLGQRLGGTQVSGLSARYGATLLGGH